MSSSLSIKQLVFLLKNHQLSIIKLSPRILKDSQGFSRIFQFSIIDFQDFSFQRDPWRFLRDSFRDSSAILSGFFFDCPLFFFCCLFCVDVQHLVSHDTELTSLRRQHVPVIPLLIPRLLFVLKQGKGTGTGHRTLLYGNAVLLRHLNSDMVNSKSVKSPIAGLCTPAIEPPQTPPFTALFPTLLNKILVRTIS